MVEDFLKRVETKEGFDHELHVIEIKMFLGILHHPEDSYMWPYILEAWDKFGPE